MTISAQRPARGAGGAAAGRRVRLGPLKWPGHRADDAEGAFAFDGTICERGGSPRDRGAGRGATRVDEVDLDPGADLVVRRDDVAVVVCGRARVASSRDPRKYLSLPTDAARRALPVIEGAAARLRREGASADVRASRRGRWRRRAPGVARGGPGGARPAAARGGRAAAGARRRGAPTHRGRRRDARGTRAARTAALRAAATRVSRAGSRSWPSSRRSPAASGPVERLLR